MPRDSRRLLILFLFLLLFVITSRLVPITTAQDVKNVFITDAIDSSEFPDVTLSIRAIDGDNQVVPLLTGSDIVLYENDQAVSNITMGAAERGPVYVVFMLDRGRWSDFRGAMDDTVRDSMLQFMGDYFRDDIDTVAIMAQTNNDINKTITLLEPTQSTAEFVRSVNTLDLQASSNQTRGLLGVEASLNLLSELSDPGYAGTAVIYIGKLIELPTEAESQPQARTLAAESTEQFAKIYTIHTETGAETKYEKPLQTLSTGTGGEYIRLFSGRDNSGNLNRIYQSIMDQGLRYPLSYRSALGESGTRTVVAAPFGTPAELATHEQEYNITVSPPKVEIQSANNESEIMREVVYDDENTWSYEPDSITVVANLLSWPDDHERKIKSAVFTVGGEDQPAQTNPVGNSFSHRIDISEITSAKSIVVKVTLLDELGIEAESNSFTINIDAEPIPAPTPTPTPTPDGPCDIDPQSAECILPEYGPWFVTGLLFIIIIVMGIIFWIKLGSLGAVANAAGGAISERGKRLVEVGKTMLGGGGRQSGTVLAKLHIMVARRDLEGSDFKIRTNKTTIGRDPRLCDVLLYEEDEVSSVSAVHCTIQYDRGQFLITDDNSSNGTEVNGEILPANSPRVLNNDDEIILGDIFHRGAKFRFEILIDPSQQGEMNTPPDAGLGGNDDAYAGETILDLSGSDADMPTVAPDEDTMFGDEYHNFLDEPPNNETDWLDGLE